MNDQMSLCDRLNDLDNLLDHLNSGPSVRVSTHDMAMLVDIQKKLDHLRALSSKCMLEKSSQSKE